MKHILTIFAALGLLFALSACGDQGSQGDEEVDLSAVMAEIEGKFSLPDMTAISTAEDLVSFYGIVEEDVESFAIQISSNSVNQDELVFIHAVDSEAAGRVKDQLEARYESKLEQMENYLPDQYEMIQACSVEVCGDYVSMIISPDAADMAELYNSYF